MLASTSIAVVVALMLLYTRALPVVTGTALGLPLTLRILVAVGMLAPLAFCMGMPFPTGLRLLTSEHQRFVPWAWGANGVASVLGSVLSILLSMSYGFSAVLYVAIVIYAIAALTILTVRARVAATALN